VVFGSAARGGFVKGSDVDLLLVLADGSRQAWLPRLRAQVQELETTHGFRPPAEPAAGALTAFLDQAAGNGLSCFVCTRSDLLSGEVGRVLGLRGPAVVLVDRIVLASILAPAVTAWGEEFLAQVSLPPIRRLDVFKAGFAFVAQLLLTAATFPWGLAPTKHALGILKRAVHSCYFCCHGQAAPLAAEVAYFCHLPNGPRRTLRQLVAMRTHYRESAGFVLRCLPALLWLHWHAAWTMRIPSRGTVGFRHAQGKCFAGVRWLLRKGWKHEK
jgi:hypothetical protein